MPGSMGLSRSGTWVSVPGVDLINAETPRLGVVELGMLGLMMAATFPKVSGVSVCTLT